MKRFLLLAVIVIAAVFGSVARGGAAEKTVGVILTADTPFFRDAHKAFTDELKAKGIKVELLVQTPSPEIVAWSNAARKLVAVGVDVIVVYGSSVALAVLQETNSIPIVFAGVFDPEASGLTGKKNVTGISSKVPITSIIKILKDSSGFDRLGIIYSDIEKDSVKQASEVESMSARYSFKAVRFNIRKFGDASKIKDVDALYLTTSCSAQHCADDILGVAKKLKLPSASAVSGSEDRGVIITVSADPKEQGREAADILIKLLEGGKPSAIPHKSPKKINLIINIKEANDIGLKIPFDVLSSATKVIK